jgi:integrase
MPNKTVAKQLETRIDFAVATGTWRELKEVLAKGSARSVQNPTIGEFAEEYLKYCRPRNRSIGFKHQNVRHLVRIIGGVKIRDFKRRHADRFVDERRSDGVSDATVNRGLAVLKDMLSLAVEREYLQVHPLSKYALLKEMEYSLQILTYKEYRTLIDAVTREDPIIGAYTLLLGETGMRKQEGLLLKWDQLHLRQNERRVILGKTKSRRVRSVPLSELAWQRLDQLVRFLDIEYVFIDPLRRKRWKDPRGPFDRGKKKAGLDWATFHGLRHFRATQWLSHGVDVNTVKELLGHSSIQTTMRYVHYVHSHASQVVVEAQKKEVDDWLSQNQGGYKVDTGGKGSQGGI